MLSLLPEPRPAVRAEHGVVATSHPAAAEAGRDILRAGGTAVDAAVATAAALTVVEPTSNGIGGDAFALVWDGSRLHGYNGSGRAPAALTGQTLRELGHDQVPLHGWAAVTVPGQVRAWADLHERFGRLPWERVLEPAVRLASEGCPVPPVVAHYWERGLAAAAGLTGPEFAGFVPTFAPTGGAPRVGDTVRLPDHARTLSRLAECGADDFYTGGIGRAIAEFASRTGGFLTAEDLARHEGEWVEPVITAYRGYAVAEIPPNGQGIAALVALGILEGLDLGPDPADPTALHLQIEAMRLAFADTFAHVGDPQHVAVPTSGLLDAGYLAGRRSLIGERASEVRSGSPPRGGTVLLCTADANGTTVGLIQSNFHGFGSGVVVPGWGIALQNRGSGFVLDEGHPNELRPGRRPFHTIIPGFLLRHTEAGGLEPVGPFGVMGGHMQAQGHVQVVLQTVAGADPQEALDAPRWRVEGDVVLLEPGLADAADALRRRGHAVRVGTDGGFGRGQAIWRSPEGGWVAGSETRCDGLAAGY
ncbi:gamma-glutamyltransferase [Nostocoides sp. F2B08]|uniref:gamma-glutamyltransferase family protein n=1 Tax=Nostocoides sp. F2B08 TaxID=2653936 RepID=UPI001263708E|nr:gamma-glutamyltransferase family protein [Tetrasphaera sp. F2B08]KAB7743627.1 gamma-glutamyltransferase [Tetrasphaera sp. F2B08]